MLYQATLEDVSVDIWSAIFLGIVQGLAEFLPTGILGVVLKKIQPMEGFMDVSLAWGSAVCVIWFLAGLAVLLVIRKKRAFFPALETGTQHI